jgi:hypothetical protein
MKAKIFALAVALATFTSNASAAIISISYTGAITRGGSLGGTPFILVGDPFSLSYSFNTDLAAPGNYINTGSSSGLSGSVPAVGSALFSTPGLGFLGSGLGGISPGASCGLFCSATESASATTGSTSQFVSIGQAPNGLAAVSPANCFSIQLFLATSPYRSF